MKGSAGMRMKLEGSAARQAKVEGRENKGPGRQAGAESVGGERVGDEQERRASAASASVSRG